MTTNAITRVGLVSDTHGLFDPALPEVLAGVECVLHAGDVGNLEVLRRIEGIAPVAAVRGNVDLDPQFRLPSILTREVRGEIALVTHFVGQPDSLNPVVQCAMEQHRPAIVLSGHTHRPLVHEWKGVLFVNPGSCGPRRFDLPRTCGILEISDLDISVRIVDIETRREARTRRRRPSKREPRS